MAKSWHQIQEIGPTNYHCTCGNMVASARGWRTNDASSFIYICPMCGSPTYFDESGKQYPGVKFGDTITNISDRLVETLYEEARSDFSVGSFTSVVLACRKLLMHVAVSKGAEEGKKFEYYVDYLHTNNIIPIDTKEWVDHIRSKGNESNHEIVLADKDDAETILTFTGMLLKLVYEYPSRYQNLVNTPKVVT